MRESVRRSYVTLGNGEFYALVGLGGGLSRFEETVIKNAWVVSVMFIVTV